MTLDLRLVQAGRRGVLAVTAAIALATAGSLGCRVEPIDLPPPSAWHTYENPRLGVAFDIPDFFAVDDSAGGAVFRIHGANAVLLRFVDETEARHRGLWVGTAPAGAIELGGVAGERYVYQHGDGPVWSLTEAYVVPYRGKQLGLEFRTSKDAGVRERMLTSFHFLPAAKAGEAPAS